MGSVDGDDAPGEVANACVEPKNGARDRMLLSNVQVVKGMCFA